MNVSYENLDQIFEVKQVHFQSQKTVVEIQAVVNDRNLTKTQLAKNSEFDDLFKVWCM